MLGHEYLEQEKEYIMEHTTLTPDLYWLTLTALLTSILWIPHIMNLILANRLKAVFSDADATLEPESAWAIRGKKAHINAQLNLGVFAVLVLTAHVAGIDTAAIGKLAMIYFFLRVGHYLFYAVGSSFLRTAMFFLGAIVQILIALHILHIL
jgi:uncharacterized MAPEG superfamily protein